MWCAQQFFFSSSKCIQRWQWLLGVWDIFDKNKNTLFFIYSAVLKWNLLVFILGSSNFEYKNCSKFSLFFFFWFRPENHLLRLRWHCSTSSHTKHLTQSIVSVIFKRGSCSWNEQWFKKKTNLKLYHWPIPSTSSEKRQRGNRGNLSSVTDLLFFWFKFMLNTRNNYKFWWKSFATSVNINITIQLAQVQHATKKKIYS